MNEADDTPRDEALSRRYREAADGAPPPALDARILAAAQAAVRRPAPSPIPARPWWQRLRLPLGVAATALLATMLSLTVQRQAPETLDVETARPQSVPVPSAAPARPQAEAAREAAVPERRDAVAQPAPAEPAKAVPPTAAPMPAAKGAPAPAAAAMPSAPAPFPAAQLANPLPLFLRQDLTDLLAERPVQFTDFLAEGFLGLLRFLAILILTGLLQGFVQLLLGGCHLLLEFLLNLGDLLFLLGGEVEAFQDALRQQDRAFWLASLFRGPALL